MIANHLKNENKKILIVGIENLSVSLGKILADYGNNVIFFEKNTNLTRIYRETIDKPLEVISTLDYDFNDFDYIIVGKKLDIDDSELANLLIIINKLINKTYAISEIIYNLYPEKYFIHIIGETYRDLVYPELEYIYKENSVNIVKLPFAINEDEEELNYIDISKIDVFMVSDCNREFIKDLNFNILGFFELHKNSVDNCVKNLFLKQSQDSKVFINMDNEYLKEFYKDIRDNDNIFSKIIGISTKKLTEGGYSYINDTIFCYADGNESYDLVENEYTMTNISKISRLASFAIAVNTGQNANTVVECQKTFRGVANIVEYVGRSGNIRFVSNIFATTDEILTSPFEAYSNIYAILVLNDKQNDFSWIKNYSKNIRGIFLIDIHNLVDLNDNNFKISVKKYKNINDAFTEIMINIKEDADDFCLEEATILLSPIASDKMNSIYYKEYSVKFKKLVDDLI